MKTWFLIRWQREYLQRRISNLTEAAIAIKLIATEKFDSEDWNDERSHECEDD